MMKRLVLLLSGIMFLFLLAACDETEVPVMDDKGETVPLAFGTDYEVEEFRTEPLSGYPVESREEVIWIDSTEALASYMDEYGDSFQFDWGDPSFREHIETYDETFFENHHLFFIVVDEFSGSVRHGIEEITAAEGILNIHLSRSIPEIYTTDMACWHVVVELAKDAHIFHSVNLIIE